jgi:hypothetical protein
LGVTASQYIARKLTRHQVYYFRVRACADDSCSKWAKWRAFHVD